MDQKFETLGRPGTVSKDGYEKDAQPISTDLQHNINYIHYRLNSPGDLVTRELQLGASGKKCVLMNIDGLIDKMLIHENLMKPMFDFTAKFQPVDDGDEAKLVVRLKDEVLPLEEIQTVSHMSEILFALLSGDTCLFVDGSPLALVVCTKGWLRRPIEEPQTESLIRGPKDGFTEDIRINSSLVRRRIKDPSLRLDSMVIGKRSKREVMVAYIEGIVNTQIVKEVKRRLDSLDIDDPEGSGYIEQWINDSFLSPFPQLLSTERPDRFVLSLLNGKVGIIVDGTPFSLILPSTLSVAIFSPEDYYQPWLLSSLVRMLRLVSAFLATFLPGFYIALAEYHHGMIPSNIAFSIASAREGVPFPVIIEAFLMEATLEILREAGVRLPKPIGQTIGIVGGLVIGEAAVSAGLVSPVMVIVVAVTAIASFTLPAYSYGIVTRILRFFVMVAAAIFGLFGVILAFLVICIHLVNLKSFGVPYLTPVSPLFLRDWKDLILRAPVGFMRDRPYYMQTRNRRRMK